MSVTCFIRWATSLGTLSQRQGASAYLQMWTITVNIPNKQSQRYRTGQYTSSVSRSWTTYLWLKISRMLPNVKRTADLNVFVEMKRDTKLDLLRVSYECGTWVSRKIDWWCFRTGYWGEYLHLTDRGLTGVWRILYYEELHYLHYSQHFIRMIKSGGPAGEGHNKSDNESIQ